MLWLLCSSCVYNKTPKLFDTWHFHCANKRGKNAIKPKELQFHSFFRSFVDFFTLEMIKKTIEIHCIQRHSSQESITIRHQCVECGSVWNWYVMRQIRSIWPPFVKISIKIRIVFLRFAHRFSCHPHWIWCWALMLALMLLMSLLRLQNVIFGVRNCSTNHSNWMGILVVQQWRRHQTHTHAPEWQWFEVYMKESDKKNGNYLPRIEL